jgi:hypothetical protein
MGIAAETPSDVVRKFCQLDYEGARLSSVTYKKIIPLVAYPEEPGWDIVIGIRSYEIKKEQIQRNKAEVIVVYDLERSWPPGIRPNNREVIKLVKVDGVWRIEEYITYPRVSLEVLCKEFNRCK